MRVPVLLGCLALASPLTHAATVVLSTSTAQITPSVDNQGWLSSVSPNENSLNDNYLTGTSRSGEVYRSYFSFSLGSLTGPVTSARFEVRRYGQLGVVNLGLWDVSASASELTATRDGVLSPQTFADLGSGINYGTFDVLEGDSDDLLVFELDTDAIGAINARLALGGDYFSLGAALDGDGYLFAGSNDEPGASGGLLNSPQRLVLTLASSQPVPEPGSLALAALALAALAARASRRSTALM
jgi:hypothetical protein